MLLLTKWQGECLSDCISCVTLLPSKVTTAIYFLCPLLAPPQSLWLGKCIQGHCPQRYREERYPQALSGGCKLTRSLEAPGHLMFNPIQFCPWQGEWSCERDAGAVIQVTSLTAKLTLTLMSETNWVNASQTTELLWWLRIMSGRSHFMKSIPILVSNKTMLFYISVCTHSRKWQYFTCIFSKCPFLY